MAGFHEGTVQIGGNHQPVLHSQVVSLAYNIDIAPNFGKHGIPEPYCVFRKQIQESHGKFPVQRNIDQELLETPYSLALLKGAAAGKIGNNREIGFFP